MPPPVPFSAPSDTLPTVAPHLYLPTCRPVDLCASGGGSPRGQLLRANPAPAAAARRGGARRRRGRRRGGRRGGGGSPTSRVCHWQLQLGRALRHAAAAGAGAVGSRRAARVRRRRRRDAGSGSRREPRQRVDPCHAPGARMRSLLRRGNACMHARMRVNVFLYPSRLGLKAAWGTRATPPATYSCMRRLFPPFDEIHASLSTHAPPVSFHSFQLGVRCTPGTVI